LRDAWAILGLSFSGSRLVSAEFLDQFGHVTEQANAIIAAAIMQQLIPALQGTETGTPPTARADSLVPFFLGWPPPSYHRTAEGTAALYLPIFNNLRASPPSHIARIWL